MTHTPGPWYLSFHSGICIGVQNSPDGFTEMICNSILPETDEQYEKWGKQIEADMTLIAAAPELLEALEGLSDMLSNHYGDDSDETPLIDKAFDAIKKAKGL